MPENFFQFDQLLAGTPFRGLVLRGVVGFSAYIGVPHDHCASDMETLEFECHRGITFRGPGDGEIRAEGWYWYGWDYADFAASIPFDEAFLNNLPPEMESLRASLKKGGKEWTLAEIEQDLIDSAVDLMGILDATKIATDDVVGAAIKGTSNDGGVSKP